MKEFQFSIRSYTVLYPKRP